MRSALLYILKEGLDKKCTNLQRQNVSKVFRCKLPVHNPICTWSKVVHSPFSSKQNSTSIQTEKENGKDINLDFQESNEQPKLAPTLDSAEAQFSSLKMVFRRIFVLMMGCLGCADQPTEPNDNLQESKTVVDESAISTTTCRVRLSDGRFLAYRERGVPKNKCKYRIIIFFSSQELLDVMEIYLLIYDRAGYGESDPNPKRSVKSEASDIEELADQLQLGSKYYVIGVSLGCYPTWSCIKRIPQKLAGVALVVPFVNYKWRSLPDDLTKDDYRKQLCLFMICLTRYTPGLLHWWLTQKLFPSATALEGNPTFFCDKDLDVLKNTPGYQLFTQDGLRKRRVFDSLRRDFIVAFSKWDFDPLELGNPYPQNESSVHIWQGYEDKVVPVQLQRYVSQKLPWIRYHEVPDGGHLLVYDTVVCEAILKSLLLGEDPPLYRPKLAS
uniref:AB hydrolase-1 domain-containing protein n=1 Tax=Nicotiana tabacum TaxID=4097 RepID=A0A1S3YKZ5_TOBAC|nr:PREDICTED: uncharacterized protein LOC107777160 [Nicotiana tabacum]